MKVQGANSSSRKTRRYIKTAFAELINEKKELNKITVTELVKRADITRSTFYTHYDSIYEVASDYELETIDLLINDDKILNSKDDILNYFDEIINIYNQLDYFNNFLTVLRKMANQKVYYTLKNNYKNYDTLELDVSFFIAGIVEEIIIYFKSQSDYTLDELLVNIKKWFEKIFN